MLKQASVNQQMVAIQSFAADTIGFVAEGVVVDAHRLEYAARYIEYLLQLLPEGKMTADDAAGVLLDVRIELIKVRNFEPVN